MIKKLLLIFFIVKIIFASSFKDYGITEYYCKLESLAAVLPNGEKKFLDSKSAAAILPNNQYMTFILKNKHFIISYHENKVLNFIGTKDGYYIYKYDNNYYFIDKTPENNFNKIVMSYVYMDNTKLYMTYKCNPK